MIVKNYDAPGRYLVESERNTGTNYVVDVLAFNGNGECSCDDFSIRIAPAMRDGTPPVRSRCKHIVAARDAFATDVITRMIANATGGAHHGEE